MPAGQTEMSQASLSSGPGVAVKNIVLCFDRTQDRDGATNVAAIGQLLEGNDAQVVWYPAGRVPGGAARPARRRRAAASEAHDVIVSAYRFLTDHWQPGDAIFMFGAGRGAYCARALTHLLDLIGVADDSDAVVDYVLATYPLPRTVRTTPDWHRLAQLLRDLADGPETSVPVRFLGLWDMTGLPGLPAPAQPITNVMAGRHAVAIDSGLFETRMPTPDGVDEVWFRGAHCDATGGRGACWPLADIALDWMLDGAIAAGAVVDGRDAAPTPGESDALAGSVHPVGRRRPPIDALVHASVEVYVRAHPHYWRRLPARVTWADRDWLARGERLAAIAPATPPAPQAAAELTVAS